MKEVEHLREPLELSVMSLALRSRVCQVESGIQLHSSKYTVLVSSVKSCGGSVFSSYRWLEYYRVALAHMSTNADSCYRFTISLYRT